jgi:hypothetical protein
MFDPLQQPRDERAMYEPSWGKLELAFDAEYEVPPVANIMMFPTLGRMVPRRRRRALAVPVNYKQAPHPKRLATMMLGSRPERLCGREPRKTYSSRMCWLFRPGHVSFRGTSDGRTWRRPKGLDGIGTYRLGA